MLNCRAACRVDFLGLQTKATSTSLAGRTMTTQKREARRKKFEANLKNYGLFFVMGTRTLRKYDARNMGHDETCFTIAKQGLYFVSASLSCVESGS